MAVSGRVCLSRMENPIITQLLQSAVFALGGMAAGVWYDLLWVLRRGSGRLYAELLLDLLFWIVTGLWIFYLSMSVGEGRLQIFMLVCMGLGLCFYFRTVGGPIRGFLQRLCGVFGKILQISLRPLKVVLRCIKKALLFFKKFFPNRSEWFTIIWNKRKNRQSDPKESEVRSDAAEKGWHYN